MLHVVFFHDIADNGANFNFSRYRNFLGYRNPPKSAILSLGLMHALFCKLQLLFNVPV